ncbi:MAG: hemerythrin domain-containing protein [Flavobacteriales bacterium]|nr:hemerythrin domain-containing protein [Flavobacteriales bacterium]
MPEPIKRHRSLQPVSREHHHGLLLSWKIRQGLSLGIAPERIKKYTDWFWENHLQPHFEFEENYVFSILEKNQPLIKRALAEHRHLEQLFTAATMIESNLVSIEQELAAHIRFEERVLFNEVQKVASEEQLNHVEHAHSNSITEDWQDEFWVRA